MISISFASLYHIIYKFIPFLRIFSEKASGWGNLPFSTCPRCCWPTRESLIIKGTYAKMARGDMVKFLVPHISTPKTPTQNETTSPNLETGEKYQDGQ